MPICPLGVERMITDCQVRRLIRLSQMEQDQEIAAVKAGMDAKTARKYLRVARLPSELRLDRQWRATEGPAQEVFFSQKHEPGRLCASDFTHMTGLQITINRQTLEHLVYHFVLTYSNWET